MGIQINKKVGPVLRDQRRTGILFILVPMVLFITFAVYPMFYSGYLSLTDFSFTTSPKFVGFDNFSRLIQDDIFWTSFRNTTLYTLGVVPISMVLALFMALLLNEKVRGITIFRVAFYLPVLTSTIVSGMIWLWMYAPGAGIINQVFEAIGLPPQRWLFDPKLALISVMIVAIWKNIGYIMVIFLASLQGVPSHLYEAAEIDGANYWNKLWNITIPLIKPATFFVLVTSMISAFQVFGSVFVMTKGGPGYSTTTIVYQIYLNGFRYFRMGYASAESIILFIVIFALSLFNWQFLRSDNEIW